jgi:predicted alpha-1,2-mannosidase
MAEKMGKRDIASSYFKRANYYSNVYDSSTRHMRGKDSKGNWRIPFNPLVATSPMNNPGDYTEANAWQYFWTPAQYDVEGMMQLLGGKKNFTAQLDSFFAIKAVNPNKHLGQEAMIGQYAHGNEPSHHIAYLYAYSDKPQRTGELVAQICQAFYNNTTTGMIGNDDCGQMSAWYIFSTLGFYPVNPANGEYVLGKPQVKKATVHLSDGKILQVMNNNSKTVLWNGASLKGVTISHKALAGGGVLKF